MAVSSCDESLMVLSLLCWSSCFPIPLSCFDEASGLTAVALESGATV